MELFKFRIGLLYSCAYICTGINVMYVYMYIYYICKREDKPNLVFLPWPHQFLVSQPELTVVSKTSQSCLSVFVFQQGSHVTLSPGNNPHWV